MDHFTWPFITFISVITGVNLLVGWYFFGLRDKLKKAKQIELELLNTQKLIQTITSGLEQKNTMIKILTHDISNCLIPLNFFTKLIGKKKVEQLNQPEFDKAINRIEVSTSRISSMVIQVRNYEAMVSRASSERLKFVSLKQCLDDALLIFYEKLNEKNIICYLNFHRPVTEQINVFVDPASFTNSVLNNLISNSLKFSFQNSVIDIDITAANNGMVEISFTDYGVGMSEQTMRNIFSFQHNTSKDGTSGEKGTGFGMPILKKYIEIYEGEISVQSKEKTEISNGYTCFKILLKGQY